MKFAAIWLPIILGVLGMTASLHLYSQLPDPIAIHWNLRGEPDGYLAQPIAAFLLPGILLVLGLVYPLLRRLESRAGNLRRSSSAVNALLVAVTVVLAVVHGAVLAAAVGTQINAAGVALAAIGLLITLVGNYMGKTRSNGLIGIRNRWTLSHEAVWGRTHRLAGRLLVANGLMALAMAWFHRAGPAAVLTVLALLAVTFAYLHWYSFNLWRRLPGGAT